MTPASSFLAAVLLVVVFVPIASAIENPFPMTIPTAPVFPARTFDIRDYGAVGGGETLNTKAIAVAIAACAKAGGGRVVVPAGIWLTGPVQLRSKVELYVTEGAELRFSRRYSDYLPVVYTQRGGVRCFNYSPLIYARGCTDVAVTGPGTLHGQGDAWWDWKNKQPGMARLFEMGAKSVRVEQRVFGAEADGVRPPFIQTIDCRNVFAYDCEFDGTDRGVRIKSLPGRGGFMEQVWIQDVRMKKIRAKAVEIMLRYGDGSVMDPATKAQPALRGFRLRNITCEQADTAIHLAGLPENRIRDVSFQKVTVTAKRGVVSEWVNGLRLIGVDIRPAKAPVVQLVNNADVLIEDAGCPASVEPFLRVEGAESRSIQIGSEQYTVEFADGAPRSSVHRGK